MPLTSPSRRDFIRLSSACAAHMALMASPFPAAARTLFASRTARAIVAQEPFGRLEEVGEGLWAFISTPLGGDYTTVCNGGIIAGTEGVLVVGGGQVTVYTPDNRDGEVHEPLALEAPRRNGPEYFVHCIRSGEPIEGVCSPENSHDAQQIMEAARLSVLTGQHVSLPLVEHLY